MKKTLPTQCFCVFIFTILFSCTDKNKIPVYDTIGELNLKRGDIIFCGPPGKQFGKVEFDVSCPGKVKQDFALAMALLHSFEYDEAEKAFAKIIDEHPECAMPYWGVAMSNYHQVWPSPPSALELDKGNKAISIAQSLIQKTERESDYIDAMAVFYKDWNKTGHHTRSLLFEKAMENLYKKYSDDKEAAILYALTLDGTADPADKTYTNQKKAGAILTALYRRYPDHPGIVHYILHSYDSPELASLALPAARKYAAIAPSSAHAQHMPSHIFVRLGLWDESIRSNLVSTNAAKCYAESAGVKGHWDEELHGMDYLVYAYLQKGETDLAKKQYDYLKTIKQVYPENFKVAYAFAAIPSRYFLETKMWDNAAKIEFYPATFPWDKFPWQKAIVHFAHVLGNAHIGNISLANEELKNLETIYETLTKQKDIYKANQVLIQLKAGEAWIKLQENKTEEALTLMNAAADLESKTEKSPVTPGEVLPAKELLADMLLQLNRPVEALAAYEDDLKTHPNRFNGINGAAMSSVKINNTAKATYYYKLLKDVSHSLVATRPELETAGLYLQNHHHY